MLCCSCSYDDLVGSYLNSTLCGEAKQLLTTFWMHSLSPLPGLHHHRCPSPPHSFVRSSLESVLLLVGFESLCGAVERCLSSLQDPDRARGAFK